MASYEKLSTFTHCTRHVCLCAYGQLNNQGGVVMLLRALRFLRHYLFTYLTWKKNPSHFYPFCSALFGLSVFYAN